jgi:hypothetical protein
MSKIAYNKPTSMAMTLNVQMSNGLIKLSDSAKHEISFSVREKVYIAPLYGLIHRQ